MKRSTFVILTRKDNGQFFGVYNSKKNHVGFPGGKEEIQDNEGNPVGSLNTAQYACACREFKEETGIDLPDIQLEYFEWATCPPRRTSSSSRNNSNMPHHIIRIYHGFIEEDIARTMGGRVNDPGGGIVSCGWYTDDYMRNAKNVPYHMRKAFHGWQLFNNFTNPQRDSRNNNSRRRSRRK